MDQRLTQLSLSEQQKWDSYYADLPPGEEDEATREFNAQFASAVSTFLVPGSRVLEAGCGSGWQSLALARTGHYSVSLMDFSNSALNYARRLFQRERCAAEFVAGDVLGPGQPAYDLVFNAGTLGHDSQEYQTAFLKGMATRSRQFVLALVPNSQCYWYWQWRIQSAVDGRWPSGEEAPTNDLSEAFEAAGLTIVGHTYLDEAWTEAIIRDAAAAAPELRDSILAVHRSPLIPAAQKSYLVAWLGIVPGATAPNLSQWQVSNPARVSAMPEILAALSDALALRLVLERQLTDFRSQLDRAQEINTRLKAQLGDERQTSDALRSQLAAGAQVANAMERTIFGLRAQLALGQQTATDLARRHQAEVAGFLSASRSELAEKTRLLAEARAQLERQAQDAAARESMLAEQAEVAGFLNASRSELAEKTRLLAVARAQLETQVQDAAARESALVERNQALAAAEAASQQMAQSKFWRMGQAYWTLRWRLRLAFSLLRPSADRAIRVKAVEQPQPVPAVTESSTDTAAEASLAETGPAPVEEHPPEITSDAPAASAGDSAAEAVVCRATSLENDMAAEPVAGPPIAPEDGPAAVPAAAPLIAPEDQPAERLAEGEDFYSPLIIRPNIPETQLSEIRSSRPLPQPRRQDVICFSIIDWATRYQRPQQIMSQFAAHGHRVFYINLSPSFPPGAVTRFRVRSIKENLFELVLPTRHLFNIYAEPINHETEAMYLGELDDLRRTYDITDAVSYVMLVSWGNLALEARRRWGWQIIYDCMDEWDGFPGIGRSVIQFESRFVAEADLIVVTAQRLYDKWQALSRSIVLARNAVDHEFYQQRLQPNSLLTGVQHPIVGFYGAIAEWFDLDLIRYLAVQRPEYTFILIGGIFDVDVSGLQALPNVRLLGQQPYETMPGYLYHFDACLIPFKVNAITQAVDPVKLYEYLSSGKPVVAVALAELEAYHAHAYLSDNREDFLANLDAAIREHDPLRTQERKLFAQANTWTHRYVSVVQALAAQAARASLIVVTHNNLALSRLCLESIILHTAYPNYELIVVDNHSSDGTQSYLRQLAAECANVHLILNEDNRGFAYANNQGLAVATGEYLVLLNNDTIVSPGWLARLLRHLDDPSIGLVGPLTNFAGNEAKLDVDYNTWREMQAFARTFTWQREGQQADIRMLAMFCLGLRREVFQAIGPLDEQFGLGMFEDDDYVMRARHLGYRVVCAMDVFVHHFGQSAFRQLIADGRYDRLFAVNRQLFEIKWQTEWQPHRHGMLVPYRSSALGDNAGVAGAPGAPAQGQTRASPEWHAESAEYDRQVLREKQTWGDHLEIEASGAWNAWLDHPLVKEHYFQRSLLDGLRWEEWTLKWLGEPAQKSLDLGCGAGDRSLAVWKAGTSRYVEGADISDERVAEGERRRQAVDAPGHFRVADVNRLMMPENTYDLIFSCHSFHHFLELETVLERVARALTPRGLFILEEYVGPTQFQWTERQMQVTAELLAMLPHHLRRFHDGQVKVFEGRPMPEQVAAVSPFESIRSAEIAPLFQQYFKVLAVRDLGGTIQQLLYNGIVHNFELSDAEAIRYLRHIYEVEDQLIDSGQVPSDFRLLIGRRSDAV